MMRLSSLGHESGVAAGGRLKTREERGMGSRPPSISTSFDHASESDDDDDADANESASVTDARSPEAASFGSYATASPLLIHKAASALWHAPPSLHGHHDLSTNCSTNDMNGGTWRDVVISSSAGNHDELPPLGSTVTPTPAISKRKKTKKEVFICHEPNCGKQFPRSFALRRHMRIHTGTKPYACDHDGCTQRFNTSGNLSRHKRIHSGERPYPCIFSTCGKKFNTSTKLKRHMRIHFPEGQNVFRCVGLNCSWSCDNYKEFAAHQKLQHNIIVGAGLEAVSAAAAAAIASATGTSDHGMDTQYGDTSASSDTQGYASNGYMYGYGKPSTLPPPSSSQSRKQTSSSNASGSNSSQQYNYDTSFASLSGLARETKHKTQDIGDNMYDHYRRTKSSSSNGYTLPTTSFPPADAAGSHYASSRGSIGLSSMYESGSSLTMSSESSSYGAPSLRTGSLFNHTLGRHDDSVFKTEHDNGHNDHQSHTHTHTSSAHHHILRPPPSSSHHDHDGMKFAVPPPMNPAAPEFTGEELSVVLELMKDSYY